MGFNLIAAIIAGLAGTAVMTLMMLTARSLHLPAVDAQGILGHVSSAERAGSLGYVAHFANGALFGVGYALAFAFVPVNVYVLGAMLGVIHWLLVGWLFAYAPRVHAGMQAGTVAPTGPYMLESLGLAGFLAGLAGHVVFGLTVAGVYSLLVA